MIQPSIERLLEVMEKKGYKVYDSASVDWNLNIVGIRNRSLVPKKFDDTLVVFQKFMGDWYTSYYPVTTDPGVAWLKKPKHKRGTAILKEGQYRSAYMIRKHANRYLALCQKRDGKNNVDVYRDNSKTGELTFDEATVESGQFGINIHKVNIEGNKNTNTKAYSQGCTIFADKRHFKEFMLKCTFGRKAFGNSFTYTLLNEKDFDQ